MRRSIFSLYKKCAQVVAAPAAAEFFLRGDVGREYAVGMRRKLRLMREIRRNIRCIIGATGYYEHLLLAAHLLTISASTDGVVVECGCFKGRSTATLSLLCSLTGRRLVVFDSFEGLPEVADDDRVHVTVAQRRYELYNEGDYRGTLEEVRDNVARYGSIDSCEFVKGYFEDSLVSFDREVCFAFLDVDLHASLQTCLIYLWPRLVADGVLMTHEAQQLQFASVFFDRPWWRKHLSCDAPGLIGAGTGLPAGMSSGSGIGYAVKLPSQDPTACDSGFSRFCGDPTQSVNSD